MATRYITNVNEQSIGSGVLFPIQITSNSKGETGWYPVNGDPGLISHNLESLFVHEIGYRFRQEWYGTRLWELLEEPNTQAQAFIAKEFLIQAINTYEPRLSVQNVEVYPERTGSLKIIFTYNIIGTSITNTSEISYDLNL